MSQGKIRFLVPERGMPADLIGMVLQALPHGTTMDGVEFSDNFWDASAKRGFSILVSHESFRSGADIVPMFKRDHYYLDGELRTFDSFIGVDYAGQLVERPEEGAGE